MLLSVAGDKKSDGSLYTGRGVSPRPHTVQESRLQMLTAVKRRVFYALVGAGIRPAVALQQDKFLPPCNCRKFYSYQSENTPPRVGAENLPPCVSRPSQLDATFGCKPMKLPNAGCSTLGSRPKPALVGWLKY